MAKNVIIMIGDGMDWEMARAAATANVVPFYTSGQGEGLNFQTLANYTLATTYGTTIADSSGNDTLVSFGADLLATLKSVQLDRVSIV